MKTHSLCSFHIWCVTCLIGALTEILHTVMLSSLGLFFNCHEEKKLKSVYDIQEKSGIRGSRGEKGT